MINLLNYILEILHRAIHNDLKIHRIGREQPMIDVKENRNGFIERIQETPLSIDNSKKNKLDKRNEEELVNVIKAMSEDELRVIASIIPVEMCMERIQSELNAAAALRDKLTNVLR